MKGRPTDPTVTDDVDTIAAVATPPGIGGIAVVRVSGPGALCAAEKVFRRGGKRVINLADTPSHTAHYGHVVDPEDGSRADEVLLLLMKAPRSFTGEDVVEFHCHGGPVPVGAVLRAVLAAGARTAEAGEFTRRAFLNGRLDLTQAEAVADIIAARSRVGARLALRQLEGELGERIGHLRSSLIDLMAHLEVVLDYPEMDIEEKSRADTCRQLREVGNEIARLLETASAGRSYREGVRTVILGRPNVGKSSLLNALLQRERAIVTELPGTTRDVLEETLVVRGVPLLLTDTAGVRQGSDRAEEMGVRRAQEAARGAELILAMFDDSIEPTEDDRRVADQLNAIEGARIIAVVNKIDLRVGAVSDASITELVGVKIPVVRLSARTREGLDDLEAAIFELVVGEDGPGADWEGVVIGNARHEEALRRARGALEDAAVGLEGGLPADLVSIDLRECLEALGAITGEAAGEDLLDRIFSKFCVGK
ncbi:MAG: tRNA uridine-5-carboxymethylaminomethyl(34) synthesis GTPase MnmE [Bacillota bacterium]